MKQKTLPNGSKKQFGCPAPCMGPRASSCHRCPLWAFQFADMYCEGTQSLWEAVSMMLRMDGQ